MYIKCFSLISSQGQAAAGRGASWKDTGTDTQSVPLPPQGSPGGCDSAGRVGDSW